MGKRGPAPQGEFAGKSQVLSTRIRPDTRAALNAASKETGRSLSQEIEYRLRRSFDDDRLAKETFGSRRNRALMKMLALSMETAFNPEQPDVDWLDDPVCFEMVSRMINRILESYRPAETRAELDAFEELATFSKPAALMRAVQEADDSMPPEASDRDRLANLMKSDLGPVAKRPKFISGDASDFRAATVSKAAHRLGSKGRKAKR